MRVDRFLEEKSLFLRFYDMKWLAPSIVRGEIVLRTRDTRKDGRIRSKKIEDSGKKVFIPSQDLEKCRRWIVACSRKFFTEQNI